MASQAKFQKERYQAIADRLINLIIEQQPQLDKIKKKFDYFEEELSQEQNIFSHPTLNSNTLSSVNNIENQFIESIKNEEKSLQTYDNIEKFAFITPGESIDDELTILKNKILTIDKYDSKNHENLDKIINQAIDETKEVLQSAIINQNNIQEQYEQAQKETKQSYHKIQIALQNNDDNQALNAIVSKIVHNKCVKTIENQLEQQKITLKLIENNLSILEKVKLMVENETSSQQTIDADLEALKKELDEM